MKKIKNICIIDDDPIFVLITKKMIQLSELFENTIVYKNGKEALNDLSKKIESNNIIPEIILLDINMPIMNGWKFLDEFSETLYQFNIKVFIVSSSISPSDLEKYKSYKCVVDYIVKPIYKDDIIDIVKKYYGGKY